MLLSKTHNITDKRITWGYLMVISIAVIFTWFIHEFAHWVTSELFGYTTVLRINSTSTLKGEDPTQLHQMIISASGPIITLFQALAVFLILKTKPWVKDLYPFLFTAFYMRLMAGVMNFINLNDEGRVSEYLGVGSFTIPLLISGILFYFVYSISKKYKLSWKFQLATSLGVMIVSSILILSDQFFRIQII